jgi:hypothetical protein
MPDLDVSPALESSMLSDAIQVVRRANPVIVNGRAQLATTATFNTFGVVVPASANDLDRLSDYQAQGKYISVVTEFTLQGAATLSGSDLAPDQILYNGNTYQVVSLEDMTDWGMSWTKAICQMVDAQPVQQPAQTNQGA